ncbi:MAG: smalltalk protein [Prevotella sp.]|nr:smalltalk protein [Prevotella sp.]
MNDYKKQLLKLGIQALIAALTALLTALGVTACR